MTPAASYTNILRSNAVMEEVLAHLPPFRVAVLGNVSVFQLADYLKHRLYGLGVRAVAEMGDFDNIVQDSEKFGDRECVIIFQEACSLVDGLQGRCEYLSGAEMEALAQRVLSEFDFLVRNLAGVKTVIFNRFTAAAFPTGLAESPLARLARTLDQEVARRAPANFLLLDLEPLLREVSVEGACNWRDFYGAKMLYTTRFFDAYADRCAALLAPGLGRARKALIFDADNTLWQGILGEDGVDGIRIPPPFAEVQALAKGLAARGVVLGLCSKNNPGDVDEVFEKHPDMVLGKDDILVRRVNWRDKATNLREIAEEINIGVDSLVFVDDSDFECGLVREQLPEVAVLQVPAKAHAYSRLLRENMDLFYNPLRTAEDAARTGMYRQELQRRNARQGYDSIEAYLRSLDLVVQVAEDDPGQVPRMAQLTQKTNQFNLTTRRYTEAQVREFVDSGEWKTYSITVADKYGEYGITGLCLARVEGAVARLDTFLLSCRVIGRNIETQFLDHVLDSLEAMGVREVEAHYLRTVKNDQVSDFWDRVGFDFASGDDREKAYCLALEGRPSLLVDYITLSK